MSWLPEVGESVAMSRAGTTLKIGRRLQEGGQGVVHLATVGEAVFAVKWLRPSDRSADLYKSIGTLVDRRSPHPSFVWPIDLVASDDLAGFGYVMRYMEPRFISFARMINDNPTFRLLATVARNLVDAFHALHSKGLCYRDINFGNLFVDPETAAVAICDNDNVGIDGGEVFVRGTNQFMAPEIVRDEAWPPVVLPSLVTDLYSLAVFLFIMFVRGHPLEGIRSNSTYSWAESQHVTEHELMRRHFGLDPLFVFDPKDHSNCPPPGSPMLTYWDIYPEFFKAKFTRAFTTGLMDASLAGRITAGEWRGALARLADSVSECRCTAQVFYDRENPMQKCWNCNRRLDVPPLLELSGNSIVLCEGAVVTSHHLNRDKKHDNYEAIVESYPGRPNELTLRNMSGSPWTVVPEEGGTKSVVPTQRLHVRPMTIDFGPTKGTIRVVRARKGDQTQIHSPEGAVRQ